MKSDSDAKDRANGRRGRHRVPRHWFHSYNFLWLTLGLFVFSLVGHWIFGWFAYVDEQLAHNQEVQVSQYLVEMTRDTLENWQSEFLQLLSMVVLTAWLIHKGSAESRDSTDRMEAKIDEIKRLVEGKKR